MMGRIRYTYWDIPGKLRSVALALFVLISHPVLAQEKLLPVFHFKTLEGFGPEGVTARVVRDSLGFIWIGARNGLQRYDGYNFKKYQNIPNDPHSLPSNRISSLLVDSRNRLWVGTEDCGLSLYDPARERFIRLNPNLDDSSRSETTGVSAIIEDRSGNIWLAMSSPYNVVRVEIPVGGESNDMDSLAGSLHFRKFPIGTPGFGANDICERNVGKILIASHTGLLILDPASADVSRPHLTGRIGRRLDSTLICCLFQASDGTLWLGTGTEGVYRIDWVTGKVVNYRHREGDSLSITIDEIWDIAEDRRGNIWIGTVNGVELLFPETGKRIPYMTYEQPFGGYQGIRLSVDCRGTFWVGTASDLYLLTVRSQHFPHFSFWNRWRPQNRPSPQLPGPTNRPWQALGSFQDIKQAPDGFIWGMSEGKLLEIDPLNLGIIKTIDVFEGKGIKTFGQSSILDKKGNFWHVAWDLGLFRVNLANGMVTNYNYNPPFGKTTSLLQIAQGSGDSLWVGAYNQGVFKFSPAGGRFLGTQFKCGYSVMKDHEGKIWITGYDGLNVFNPVTGTTDRFVNVSSDPHSLSQTFTQGTYEDPSGRIWVGARTVINLWNPATRSFTRYPNPAFSVYDVYPIGSDSKGRLWVIYANGDLSILDPSNGKFMNLSQDDGLCSGITSILNLEDGRILLSGAAGLNLFSANSVDPDLTPPPLVLTRMTINDEPVGLPRLLKGSGSLHLSHTQDVLEFEFAAMDIDPRGPAEYWYQLKGYERDWVKPTDRRYVRYTNIPPGDYVFKVRAASAWDRWPDQEISLAVTIAPPWWRTSWAYAGYGLCIFAFLFGGYRLRLRQIQLKHAAQMEHFQAEHLAEVDRLKSRFFANISHEFRTPLTLILGPIGQAIERENDPGLLQKLHLVENNTKKLYGLVNQLLDFSRIESGTIKLQASRFDILEFLRRTVMSFESWAERKKINLEFRSEAESANGFCDSDKIEKIVNNLISNALKFTLEGGSVSVVVQFTSSPTPSASRSGGNPLREEERKKGGRGGEFVEISVSDTGPGISAEHLPHIFERFYRVDETHTTEGTGIGLALTKELVDLHHGTITVQSSLGKGSVFTVTLPTEQSAYTPNEITDSVPQHETRERPEAETSFEEPRLDPATPPAEGKPIVLIVEDNAELRAYIRENLPADYAVQEAGNGKEGYDLATEIVPELVISDIMMPQMDGMELCRSLKEDVRTSHVPVILLTARADTDSKIEGLEIGADDYVTKPFDSKELVARVRNLIEQRRQLRKKFSEGVILKPGEVAVSSLDDKLLKKVMASIEKNIADQDFGVDELAREACLSRAHLNRKLQALTDLSPAELIRRMRLERARQLLEKNAGSIAEIAYQVGFGSPSHFSASFRERFGILPSEVYRHKG